ncbi:MAG: hypothetical protein E6X17_15455 [Sporomusaceae bacterium]|nr:hypothetical protein [Sporomusaceae bacterium]
MKTGLFSAKTGTLRSLTGLALLSGMATVFFLALPLLWVTTLGKVFAVAWAGMTAAAMVAHVQIVNQKRREFRLRRSLEKLSREMHAKRRREKQRAYLRT